MHTYCKHCTITETFNSRRIMDWVKKIIQIIDYDYDILGQFIENKELVIV